MPDKHNARKEIVLQKFQVKFKKTFEPSIKSCQYRHIQMGKQNPISFFTPNQIINHLVFTFISNTFKRPPSILSKEYIPKRPLPRSGPGENLPGQSHSSKWNSLPQTDLVTYLCNQDAWQPHKGKACRPVLPVVSGLGKDLQASASGLSTFTCQQSNQRTQPQASGNPAQEASSGQPGQRLCPSPLHQLWVGWLPGGIWQTHYKGFVTLFRAPILK